MHSGFVPLSDLLLLQGPVLEVLQDPDIAAALLKKGFEVRASHHKIFYLCIDGKITGVHTFPSHGVKEYNADLLAKMWT